MDRRGITHTLLWLGFLPGQLLIFFIFPVSMKWIIDHGLIPWIAAAFLIGYVLALIGCFFYAKEKGWPVWVGALGVFYWIGFGVLHQLPMRPVSKRSLEGPPD
jgi:hypothetical protein